VWSSFWWTAAARLGAAGSLGEGRDAFEQYGVLTKLQDAAPGGILELSAVELLHESGVVVLQLSAVKLLHESGVVVLELSAVGLLHVSGILELSAVQSFPVRSCVADRGNGNGGVRGNNCILGVRMIRSWVALIARA